jgi:hypothetical protein
METIYFTLGIVTVVGAAIAVVAVRAMIMVEKLKRLAEQDFESTHRDITMVEKTILNQLDAFIQSCDQRFDNTGRDWNQDFLELCRDLDERFNGAHREIEERSQDAQRKFDEVYRSIDSRVDKTADNISREIAEIYKILEAKAIIK